MEMVTTHFKHRLEALGYSSDLDVYWSLSYCQGDGVAFYGRLPARHEPLFKRFLDETGQGLTTHGRLLKKKQAQLLARFMDVVEAFDSEEISINRIGIGRYDHFNTMEVSCDTSPLDELLELVEEDSATPDQHVAVLNEAYPLFESFVAWLEDDVAKVSRKLEREGYNIIEAVSSIEPREVWRFETANFAVVATIEGDEDSMIDCWDEELAKDTLQDMAEGEGCCYNLRASVYSQHTDNELGSAQLGGIHVSGHLDTVNGREAGYLSEMVSEAISEARKTLAALTQGVKHAA